MDEQRYLHLADDAFRRIERAFEEVDPDLAEAYLAGDVLTITYRDGSKCIVNTQRPTRQIWLAARSRGRPYETARKIPLPRKRSRMLSWMIGLSS